MSTQIAQAHIRLTADTASFNSEMDNTRNASARTFADIKKGALDVGEKVKVGFGMASVAIGAVATATGFLIKDQYELANQLAKTAQVANTSATAIQKYSFAAKASGIEMDKLGDIFKDTQDKVGDFLSTGGGELQDFFKNVAPQAGLTAEKIRTLSGPDALQAMYDAMEKANLSQSEMIFYMEGIADEASVLIPLLKNGGEGFRLWDEAARNAGATMDEKTIRSMQELNTATKLLDLSVQGVKNQISAQFAPVLSDLAGLLVSDANLKNQAAIAGQGLANGFKYLMATGLGVVGIFRLIGTNVGAMAAAIANPLDAITIMSSAWDDMKGIVADVHKGMDAVFSLGSGQTNARVTQLTDLTIQQDNIRASLGKTGAAIQAEQKAAEESAKAHDKLAKAKEKSAKASALIPTETAKAIMWGANKLGVNPNDLAAVISFETSGTFSTNARNPKGSATGLIQFMQYTDGTGDKNTPSSKWDYYGMSRNQFGALSASQQMQYVVKYLQDRGVGDGSSIGAIYDAIAGYGYRSGTKAYADNRQWDVNRNGIVEKGEAVNGKGFRQHIRNYFPGGVSLPDVGEVDSKMHGYEQKQADMRLQIERETADKVTQINLDLQTKIEKLKQAGFSDEKQKQLEQYYKNDANAQIAQYEQAQAKKISSFADFRKSEFDKITDEMIASINTVKYDETLTESQKQLAYKSITEEAQLKAKLARLSHDKEAQQANADHQTTVENITAEASLQRREIELNAQLDSKLRQVKLDAINAQEQAALRQARIDFENELSSITDYSKTEIQKLNDAFINQRNAIDHRTDIDDQQKGNLRNALAGKHNQDLAVIRKPAEDNFNNLNAEMSGTSELLNLQRQYDSKVEIVKKALEAGVISEKQAAEARQSINEDYVNHQHMILTGGYQKTFGALGSIVSAFGGQQSKAYHVMANIEKGYALYSAILNSKVALSKAWASAPFPENLVAVGEVILKNEEIVGAITSFAPKGFATGGYTGDIPANAVAGLVHGGEYVFDAEATKALGRKNLDSIRKGDGMMGNTTVNVSVNVNSDGSSNIESDKQLGKSIGEAVNVAVQKALLKERRQGGIFAGAR